MATVEVCVAVAGGVWFSKRDDDGGGGDQSIDCEMTR